MQRTQESAVSLGEASRHPFGQPEEAEFAFVEHLSLIDRLIQVVARRKGIQESELDDFEGWAKLRLIQDDYRVFRRFRGESSISSYLLTTLLRLALDFLNHRYGRWRPSQSARRSGQTAIWLETLLSRDGIPLEEAIQILRQNHAVEASESDLRNLASKLRRAPRPQLDGESALAVLEAPDRSDERVENVALAETGELTATSLRAALALLTPEDLLIVRLLFEEGFGIAEVARQLGLDQRRLYRRRDKILQKLRRDLERLGVGAEEAAELFRAGSWTEHLVSPDTGILQRGPSPERDYRSQKGELP